MGAFAGSGGRKSGYREGIMRLELTASSSWEKRGVAKASDSLGGSGDGADCAMCDRVFRLYCYVYLWRPLL